MRQCWSTLMSVAPRDTRGVHISARKCVRHLLFNNGVGHIKGVSPEEDQLLNLVGRGMTFENWSKLFFLGVDYLYMSALQTGFLIPLRGPFLHGSRPPGQKTKVLNRPHPLRAFLHLHVTVCVGCNLQGKWCPQRGELADARCRVGAVREKKC